MAIVYNGSTQMKKYDAILFDMDGTLIDSRIGMTKAIQYALAKYDIDEKSLKNLEKFIGPELYKSLIKYYSFDEKKAWEAVLYFREYYSEKGIFAAEVYQGIHELLELLYEQGKKLLVATSKQTDYAERIIDYFHLNKYFYFVAGSNFDRTRIDKAEVIEYALLQVSAYSPDKVVMVGDRKYDIVGAKNNSIDSVGVGYGYGTREEIQQINPTYRVNTVSDLQKLLCECKD